MDALLCSIMLFGGNFAPSGWLFCDGSLLQINTHTAVFSLLGTTYGGDGKTTFALPNLTQKTVTGQVVRYIICVEGIYPSRP